MKSPCKCKVGCHEEYMPDCTHCGWNPTVEEKRKEEIRAGGLRKNETGLLCLTAGKIAVEFET